MNIFENYLLKINRLIQQNKNILELENIENLKSVNLEVPPEHFNFDLSSNISLVLSKANKLNPKPLAENIKDLLLKNISDFEMIEIAGPGFLNIKLSKKGIISNINNILKDKDNYGSKKSKKTFNIEFVSANPTGPMHVGHCRGAIFGDVLSNLLLFNGNKVIKEYYINDYGKQIESFVKSVFLRLREIKYKEKFLIKEDLYPGEYIKEIAEDIINKNKNIKIESFEKSFDELKKLSLNASMSLIKNDLNELGISHDNFFSETVLVKKNLVKKVVENLKKKKYVEEGYLDPPKGESSKDWKKIKRLIFKSSSFGDDTDRALQKNDGSWTYFANDVAYHFDKINRKFDNLVNVLGADHTGYIKRISAAVSALSENKVKLNCKVCQLVKLYKNGEPYKMSKRAGDFISVKELLSEVSKDSIRFMMLNRSSDVELDFDFDNVVEKSKENPLYYVQYAYARIASVFRHLNKDLSSELDIDSYDFRYSNDEIQILKKIAEWPKCIDISCNRLEPHRVAVYLYDLSSLFHSYWNLGKDNPDKRFINEQKKIDNDKLIFLKVISNVIKSGMNIIGVSTPEKM